MHGCIFYAWLYFLYFLHFLCVFSSIGALVDHLAAGADPVPPAARWPVALLGIPLLALLGWDHRARRSSAEQP